MNAVLRKYVWYARRLRSMSPGETLYRLRNQLDIRRERAAVHQTGFDAYQLPDNRFLQFKEEGIPGFFFRVDQETELRRQLFERFGSGVTATEHLADRLLEHEITLFGRPFALGAEIKWSRDPLTGNSWSQRFWADVDIRDGVTVGGVKWVRELNRHHHFVTLGKAYWLTEKEQYAVELCTQLDSWLHDNPPYRGVNWTSALSNAIRVINWVWSLVYIRRSPHLTKRLTGRIISAISIQTSFIADHLSKYSSANNHLIGEAAGLAFVGFSLPWLPQAKRWRDSGIEILTIEIGKQIYADGVPAEQAFNYLAFDLDFYLLIWRLARLNNHLLPPVWQQRIVSACEFLSHVMDEAGHVPAVGDSDDGRVVRLDERPDANNYLSILASAAASFNRRDLKTQSGTWDEKSHWLFGEEGLRQFDNLDDPPSAAPKSKAFNEGGWCVMRSADRVAILDCGPLGYLSLAAHGHADALSLLLTVGRQPFLIDPGTYAYREGGTWRRYFRGTSAHNTIVVDGQDQSEMLSDFLWGKRAVSNLLTWRTTPIFDLCIAEHDGYAGGQVGHRRAVLFAKPDFILVVDELSGGGHHLVEQGWHFPAGTRVDRRLETFTIAAGAATIQMMTDTSPSLVSKVVKGATEPIQGWVSNYYGHKRPAPVVVLTGHSGFPLKLATLINLGPLKSDTQLRSQRRQLQQMLSSLS